MSRQLSLFEMGMVFLLGDGNYGDGIYGAALYGVGGNASLRMGPGYAGEQWQPSTVAISTPSQNIPQFFLYHTMISQETLVGSSVCGNSDQVAYAGGPLTTGRDVIGVWIGGDPGAQATMTITGTKIVPGKDPNAG